jgi:hypothetical protein
MSLLIIKRYGRLGSLLFLAAATFLFLWMLGFIHAPAGW